MKSKNCQQSSERSNIRNGEGNLKFWPESTPRLCRWSFKLACNAVLSSCPVHLKLLMHDKLANPVILLTGRLFSIQGEEN